MIRGYHDTRQVFLANGVEIKPEWSQSVYNHSPDGFSWGYGGSGPAQLALGIILVFLPQACALKIYQDFKRDVIAALPINKDFELSPDDIREWIKTHKPQEKENVDPRK